MDQLDIISPVGILRVSANSSGITELTWIRSARFTATTNKHLLQARKELEEYFEDKRRSFDVKLDPQGTEFQKKAWMELRRIPFGKTISYQEQATRLGNASKCRAVGQANGRNPIPIIVPCHRVVSKDGSLGGFSAGLVKKEKLLAHEKVLLN